MRSHRVFVVGLLVCQGSPTVAQTTRIDHQGVACAVADRFPRLEAEFSPIEGVAIARVLFQGTSPEWYSVAMKKQGNSFFGVLPKPKKDLRLFRYYIEVTDKALGSTRTPEFSTSVIESSGACKGGILAGALGSASVVLQGPAGVVALPAGFASTGVVAGSTVGASGAATAGGGGLSTGALVGIVGGVAAAGAGVAAAVAAKGGESDAVATSYSGPVSGQYTVTQTVVGNVTNVCSYLRSLSGTMRVTLRQGSESPGEAQLDVAENAISVSGSPGCNGSGPVCCGPNTFACVLTGTPGSFACAEQRTGGVAPFSNTRSFTFSGSLSGGVISGLVTYGLTGRGTVNISSETFTGSTSFAVTLR